jgi:hypothetical protein
VGLFDKAPDLDHEYRFVARCRARGGHEFARVGYCIDIKQDCAGAGIGGEVVEHVTEIDVHHVTERDDVREADLPRGRPIEDGRDHPSRLADES